MPRADAVAPKSRTRDGASSQRISKRRRPLRRRRRSGLGQPKRAAGGDDGVLTTSGGQRHHGAKTKDPRSQDGSRGGKAASSKVSAPTRPSSQAPALPAIIVAASANPAGDEIQKTPLRARRGGQNLRADAEKVGREGAHLRTHGLRGTLLQRPLHQIPSLSDPIKSGGTARHHGGVRWPPSR